MKKILGFSLFTLLLLAAVGYVVGQYFMGSIVKTGVNRFGPQITQTKVELQGASVSPFSGQSTLSGLSVGNPPGWSSGDAFRLGKIHLSMEPSSVFKDFILIEELIIEKPEFLYETRFVASNVGDLLKNIEQSVGRRESQVKTKEGQPVKMVIRKLVLQEGRITLGVGTAAMTLPMPPVNMTDIGVAENGLTPEQVAFAVMRNVTATIAGAAAGVLAESGLSGGANEAAKQVGEALKGILGGRKQPTDSLPEKK